VPVIGGYTDDEENRRAVAEWVCSYAHYPNLLKVELLKEYNLGVSKYQSLLDGGNEITMPTYVGVSDELMDAYKTEMENGLKMQGMEIPIEICRI